MAYEVRVASQAIDDLQEISDYLLLVNEAASQRITESLVAKYSALRDFPNMGRSRDDLSPGLRNLVVGEYLIFYHVEAETVFVSRILHGMRDLSAIFRASDTEAERN